MGLNPIRAIPNVYKMVLGDPLADACISRVFLGNMKAGRYFLMMTSFVVIKALQSLCCMFLKCHIK